MKAPHTAVLLFGHREDLLATRQWVLETRGYHVQAVASLTALATVPKDPPVRLLLLCHSLSPAEQTAATAFAKTRWPGSRVHAMPADTSRVPTGILGRLMHTCEGPAQLIALVTGLLGEKPAAVNPPRRGRAA